MIAPVERVLAERAAANPLPLARVGLVAAIALHLALVALAVLGPRLGHDERRPMEFMPVALVPAQALGTGRPTPPPPQQEPAPVAAPEPPSVTEEPPPVEPEREPAMPAPTPAERPRQPEPERPRPAPSRPADTAPGEPTARQPPAADEREAGRAGDRPGSPLGSPEGTSGLGARLAGVGDPSFTYGYYLDRMLALIERNWRRPPTGDAVPEVALTFRIQRDGSVADLEIDASSGTRAFDLAGLRAVENAAPLPPLPSGYRKESLSIRLIIR